MWLLWRQVAMKLVNLNIYRVVVFLDPEQFYYNVEFVGVVSGQYTCDEVRWLERNMDQYRNNAGRYLRASFDALGEYASKANRRTRPVSSPQTERCASRLIRALRNSQTIPRGVRGLFEVARRAKDKNHRSRLMLEAWQAWDEEGRPVDEDVDAAIRAYMRAIWAELEREW